MRATTRSLNDVLQNAYGTQAVRYSLLIAALASVLAGLFFGWAARELRADINRVAGTPS
jgi:ABC-type uncharacterized transport system permease subunit